MTLQELEAALDGGRLQCQRQNGKWYAVRRNGATQRWKRDKTRFRIPCKMGFRDCFAIGDITAPDANHHLDSPCIRIIGGERGK